MTGPLGGVVRVGIGLIARGPAYLIRRRPPLPGTPMPGRWEFPGGKCEGDESPAETTVRECREEAGLDVVVIRLRRSFEHVYPHGHVELNFFDCAPRDPAAEPVVGSGFVWMSADALPGLHFPDANGPIVSELVREHRGASGSSGD